MGELTPCISGTLTMPAAFVIKTVPAMRGFAHYAAAIYSAVAQWQSIRLLTEGL